MLMVVVARRHMLAIAAVLKNLLFIVFSFRFWFFWFRVKPVVFDFSLGKSNGRAKYEKYR